MKSIVKKLVRKMNKEELENQIGHEIKNKNLILSYLKQFEDSWFTSEPMRDFCTGEMFTQADNACSDGEYIWCRNEVYHFEKYDLKLNDDFIEHVLNQAK